MYAQESEVMAQRIALHLHNLQQQPKTAYVSENKAFEMFKESVVRSWAEDGLLKGHQRKNGRVEYKLSDLNNLAAEYQYPFWRIKKK